MTVGKSMVPPLLDEEIVPVAWITKLPELMAVITKMHSRLKLSMISATSVPTWVTI